MVKIKGKYSIKSLELVIFILLNILNVPFKIIKFNFEFGLNLKKVSNFFSLFNLFKSTTIYCLGSIIFFNFFNKILIITR